MRAKERYQLRHAAGKYWLLDMQQAGGPFRPAIAVNETGAMILETFLEHGDEREAAMMLRQTYEIDEQEALEDVRAFLEQLRLQGADLKEMGTEGPV